MIRVLHIIATLDPAGAERQMAQLVQRLDRKKFEPVVCCLTRGGPLEAQLRAAGVPVHVLHKKARWDVTVFPRLLKLIRQIRPNIVHTWLPTSNTIGRIVALAAGTPVIIASERAKDAWKGSLRRCVDRVLTKYTTLILTNAEAVKRFLVGEVLLPERKISVIPNGLDLEEFDAAAARTTEASLYPYATAPAPDNSIQRGQIIGTVGRLEPQKGTAYLIDALAQLPADFKNVQLWIVGDGPERAALCRHAQERGVSERVQFLGTLKNVPAVVKRFDLFVLPSLWEGLPNVALEAMAAERAVVATAVDGTPEAVVDGVTGILTPPADAAALAKAIEILLRDPERRRLMGAAGRKRVETTFAMDQMVARTEALYLTAMKEVKGRLSGDASDE